MSIRFNLTHIIPQLYIIYILIKGDHMNIGDRVMIEGIVTGLDKEIGIIVSASNIPSSFKVRIDSYDYDIHKNHLRIIK